MTNTSLYSLGAFNYSLTPVLLVAGFVQIFGYKIQGFFQTFFQNKNFFFQTQGYQIGWSVETLIKAGTKIFFMVCCKCTGEIEYKIWPNWKRNSLLKALVVALKKKTSRFFTVFPDFISIFQTFIVLENCGANFKTFSRIQDSVQTL